MKALRLASATALIIFTLGVVASVPEIPFQIATQIFFLLAGGAASAAVLIGGLEGFSVVALVVLCSSVGIDLCISAMGISRTMFIVGMTCSILVGSRVGIWLHRIV